MKTLIIKFSTLILVILMAVSCNKQPIMFGTSMAVVGFSSSSLTMRENDSVPSSTKIYLGAAANADPTTVTLTVSTEGLDVPAVENTDYTLSSKEIDVSVGESSVTITPIDNDVFTGDKQFYLIIASNSKGYSISDQDTLVVTISDDEHPLKAWIGTYDVAAVSYMSPGNYDEAWVVTTSPVPDDLTELKVVGIAGTDVPVIAKLDKENLTITIEPGQTFGNAYGYGTMGLYKGTNDLNLIEDEPLTGTLSLDGTIHIDFWGEKIVDGPYAGYVWDVFNTTWTKR